MVVHGFAFKEVVQPPTWSELESTLRAELRDAGARFDNGNAYWTLQLCRLLASLVTRDVVRSKLDSASWALARLPQHAQPIIEVAARYYRHEPRQGDADLFRASYPSFYTTIRSLAEAVPPLT